MNLLRGHDSEDIRRNPQHMSGKLRGGHGDLTGDEEMQAETWDELVAESDGLTESRIDEVGNAQSAMLGGTGDLDRVHGMKVDEARHEKAAAEDSATLINPDARLSDDDSDDATTDTGSGEA